MWNEKCSPFPVSIKITLLLLLSLSCFSIGVYFFSGVKSTWDAHEKLAPAYIVFIFGFLCTLCSLIQAGYAIYTFRKNYCVSFDYIKI